MTTSVLLVDDDLGVLQALMRRMHKEPFQVRTATSAEEALGILSRSPIDLIVSDMNMPGMTGLELLAVVAKKYPDCIRIMLTGRPSLDVAMSAINSGEVHKFLTKPYDSGALASMIREALERRSASQKTLTPHGQRRTEPRDQQRSPGISIQQEERSALQTNFMFRETNECAASGSEPVSLLSRAFLLRLEEPGFHARIQQYEVLGLIGKGSMGVVLKARDPGLAREVALKILAPGSAGNALAHQRFAQEARYAAAIRHENVVTIFAVSEVGGIPFLVMEYVPGVSLQERLETGEKMTAREITRIGREIALGLAAAHDVRLIHRDIKPANILLEHGTQAVRITDFGLARAIDCDANLSQNGLLVGTPLYMSPEQVDGKTLSPATDLFSLGSVLYTLCTGQPPFASDSLSKLLRAIAEETPVPIRTLNPAIPDELIEIVEKLHAKSPADRVPSARMLSEWLR